MSVCKTFFAFVSGPTVVQWCGPSRAPEGPLGPLLTGMCDLVCFILSGVALWTREQCPSRASPYAVYIHVYMPTGPGPHIMKEGGIFASVPRQAVFHFRVKLASSAFDTHTMKLQNCLEGCLRQRYCWTSWVERRNEFRIVGVAGEATYHRDQAFDNILGRRGALRWRLRGM